MSIVAWRYGYIPRNQQYSLTELELRAARDAGVPCLIFMVPDDAPWPADLIDDDSRRIRQFRRKLLGKYFVDFFTTPDDLATKVAIALHSWVATGAAEPSAAPAEAVRLDEAPGPEVFLSYAHEDVAMAESLSKRIGQEKWSVFWDRQIPVGLTWDDIVEAALDAAKCVVVLWSPAARDSEWVRIEATEGAERRILAPAVIKQTKIPLRFRRIQAADLLGWNLGAPDPPGMRALVSAIGRCVRGYKGSA